MSRNYWRIQVSCQRVGDNPNTASVTKTNWSQGGIIGIYCTHVYAHTNEDAICLLPKALKGIDMAIHQVFQSLGMVVHLRPVITTPSEKDYDVNDEKVNLVGTDLHPLQASNEYDGWEYNQAYGITWITEPKHEEPASARLAYGNAASLSVLYSSAALLVIVPPVRDRFQGDTAAAGPERSAKKQKLDVEAGRAYIEEEVYCIADEEQ